MKPLSEQLEAVAKAPGICVHPGYVEVLRRAIDLAKRYEEAPVAHVCGECDHTGMRHIDGDSLSDDTKIEGLHGEKCRMVRETRKGES